MNQLSDYTDILIVAPFYLGYLWAAGKFCKKFWELLKGESGCFCPFPFAAGCFVVFWGDCLLFCMLFLYFCTLHVS